MPPAQPPLQALRFDGIEDAAAAAPCPSLSQLQALLPGDCSDAALASLLQQAPRLHDLHLSGRNSLPRCVVERRGLTRLALSVEPWGSSCKLEELPAGPYLAGEELPTAPPNGLRSSAL